MVWGFKSCNFAHNANARPFFFAFCCSAILSYDEALHCRSHCHRINCLLEKQLEPEYSGSDNHLESSSDEVQSGEDVRQINKMFDFYSCMLKKEIECVCCRHKKMLLFSVAISSNCITDRCD